MNGEGLKETYGGSLIGGKPLKIGGGFVRPTI
jgi:hypothetical protein